MRRIPAAEVEQDVTQNDQFNTEAVGLEEALLREAHQNSLDGIAPTNDGPVTTRIRLVPACDDDCDYWNEMFTPILPHLQACGLELSDLDHTKPGFLLIEDFGTTGLLGATTRKDSRNFSDFWRRNGISHKHGGQGGRWGLGKLVFSASSRFKVFFGLTIRSDDPDGTPQLMGQAVLKTHSLPSDPDREFAPHAFFAQEGEEGFQLPETSSVAVERFVRATRMTRRGEPGLSIAIPFPLAELTIEGMLPHAINNWFFPILTQKLIVALDTLVLSHETFEELAKEFGGPEFQDGERVIFLTAIHDARQAPPKVSLGNSWTADDNLGLSDDAVSELRERFAEHALVAVRAPIRLKWKTGEQYDTHFDIYLQRSHDPAKMEAYFVRGSITVPGEARRFRGRGAFGALVADDAAIASFLGDAEGPAHTTWSTTAEKVKEKWKDPRGRLREIRDGLGKLHALVARIEETTDPDALREVFSVPDHGSKHPKKPNIPVVPPPDVPPIPKRPRRYRLSQTTSGFSVGATLHSEPGMTVEIQMAYDVATGNPFSDYSDLDFDATKDGLDIVASGATVTATNGNTLAIAVNDVNFSVRVSGFDSNRDLILKERVT
jgi:hypothetical protein